MSAVSAVFAYLVMQRNDVVRKGWDDFADRVARTAKTMDRDSGNAIADRVSVRRLAIANAAEISRTLKPLEERAKALVEERDAFADALRSIANNVGAQNIPGDADMRSLATYAASKDKVVDAVDQAITSRNKVYTRLAEVSRAQLGELIDTNALKNGDTQAITPLTDAINRKGNRCSVYEKELAEISRIAGKSSSFDNDEKSYAQSAQSVRAAVSELRAGNRKLQGELESARTAISHTFHCGQQASVQDRPAGDCHPVLHQFTHNLITVNEIISILNQGVNSPVLPRDLRQHRTSKAVFSCVKRNIDNPALRIVIQPVRYRFLFHMRILSPERLFHKQFPRFIRRCDNGLRRQRTSVRLRHGAIGELEAEAADIIPRGFHGTVEGCHVAHRGTVNLPGQRRCQIPYPEMPSIPYGINESPRHTASCKLPGKCQRHAPFGGNDSRQVVLILQRVEPYGVQTGFAAFINHRLRLHGTLPGPAGNAKNLGGSEILLDPIDNVWRMKHRYHRSHKYNY